MLGMGSPRRQAQSRTLSHASGNFHSNQAFCKRSWRGWLKLLLHDLPEDSFRCSGLDTVRNSVVASQRLAAAHCTCRAGTGPAKLRTNCCCCCCLSDGLNSRGLVIAGNKLALLEETLMAFINSVIVRMKHQLVSAS